MAFLHSGIMAEGCQCVGRKVLIETARLQDSRS